MFRSEKIWQIMLDFHGIKKWAGLENTKTRGSRLTLPRMAILLTLGQSLKTEGSTENPSMHSGET